MIYMDNGATSIIEGEVTTAIMPYVSNIFGNPSSAYEIGACAKIAINNARERVADLIHTKSRNIVFTSCATESNNWLLTKYSESNPNKRIVVTAFEHPSVMNTCKYLEHLGRKISYLPVDSYGFIKNEILVDLLSAGDVGLVFFILAQNEIGTVQNAEWIIKKCKEHGVLVGCDATQALGKIQIYADDYDFMTASAHKIGGIRGAGLMYINKDNTSIEPLLFGGNQEDMLRAGTENTAAIVGFGKASEIAMKNFNENRFKVARTRDYLFNKLSENISGCHLNGNMISCDSRLYNNINCRFDDVNNMQLQGFLAQNNICISTGSACSTGISIPSYTLKAIGLTDKECFESIRITLSHHNTIEECDEVVDCIKFFVDCARTK